MLRVAIHGASGRNGRRLICLIDQSDKYQLAAALVSPTSKFLGDDAGTMCGIRPQNVVVANEWPDDIDVVIDFSNASAAVSATNQAAARKLPIVIASTGLTTVDESAIHEASTKIPICYAANYSPAVNLTMKLAQQAAQTLARLGEQVDVEIIERHHRMKEDSPSGTALKFGQLISQELSLTTAAHGREGMVGKRPANEIGYHAVRLGDDAGQHLICFGMMGELIELRCAASNRDPYAVGALAAASYLMEQKPGLYSMFDVLGF